MELIGYYLQMNHYRSTTGNSCEVSKTLSGFYKLLAFKKSGKKMFSAKKLKIKKQKNMVRICSFHVMIDFFGTYFRSVKGNVADLPVFRSLPLFYL